MSRFDSGTAARRSALPQLWLWDGSVTGTIGDVNGDGRVDLVVTSGSNTASILLGDGHGGFLPKLDFGTGHAPYGAEIADLNGDGRPEIAIANADAILVLRNGEYRLPTPIGVEDFTAEVRNDGVLLAWRLAAEARPCPARRSGTARGHAARSVFRR
jgi:hypothetical protein